MDCMPASRRCRTRSRSSLEGWTPECGEARAARAVRLADLAAQGRHGCPACGRATRDTWAPPAAVLCMVAPWGSRLEVVACPRQAGLASPAACLVRTHTCSTCMAHPAWRRCPCGALRHRAHPSSSSSSSRLTIRSLSLVGTPRQQASNCMRFRRKRRRKQLLPHISRHSSSSRHMSKHSDRRSSSSRRMSKRSGRHRSRHSDRRSKKHSNGSSSSSSWHKLRRSPKPLRQSCSC
mmetsp:Transcript_15870/g.46954  ORF Transcript_15870/g.46954 Transcript_15870/m.46954 type:complete len:235 (+) Transcript_15870:1574-2278(+)